MSDRRPQFRPAAPAEKIRAVSDRRLSDELLAAARQSIEARLSLSDADMLAATAQ